MTETFLALVPVYGLTFLAFTTAVSCLGAPLPASVVMMLMGSFAAAGEFSLVAAALTAFAAAMAGDQIGYGIGRAAGGTIIERVARKPARKASLDKAVARMERHGGLAVFLTRWLFAPLGPYVNIIAGATGFPWARFALFGALGEAIWVAAYVGLGYTFSDNVLDVAQMAGDMSGLLAAGLVTLLLGWRLVALLRRPGSEPGSP